MKKGIKGKKKKNPFNAFICGQSPLYSLSFLFEICNQAEICGHLFLISIQDDSLWINEL